MTDLDTRNEHLCDKIKKGRNLIVGADLQNCISLNRKALVVLSCSMFIGALQKNVPLKSSCSFLSDRCGSSALSSFPVASGSIVISLNWKNRTKYCSISTRDFRAEDMLSFSFPSLRSFSNPNHSECTPFSSSLSSLQLPLLRFCIGYFNLNLSYSRK